MDSNSDLSPLNKLAYLRKAVKDQTTRSLLYSGAESDGLYSEVVVLLHDRFDRCREVHANYVKAAFNSGPIKNTKAEINQMVDTVTRTLSGLKHTGQYEVNAVFTSALLPMISRQSGKFTLKAKPKFRLCTNSSNSYASEQTSYPTQGSRHQTGAATVQTGVSREGTRQQSMLQHQLHHQ